MKILKYILLFSALAFASLSARGEFRFGAAAGANYSTLEFKQDLVDVSKVIGPRAGVQGELMFPGIGFGLRIGAFYSMNGAKMDLGSRKIWASDGYGKETILMHNLEIPFNFEFKWHRMNGFEDTLMPFVFGGPVFNFNIAHSKCKAMEYPFGSIGLRAGGGVEIRRRWQISASYNWGMTYCIKAVKLENYSARNKYWSVQLTYFW